MRGDGGGRKDYAGMFNVFFKGARLSSTYKPVLLAALVDVSEGSAGRGLEEAWRKWTRREEGGGMRVDLDLAAALFAKFYWDVTAGMDPRHMPPRMADPDDPDRDVAIVRLIKEEAEKRKWRAAVRRHAADTAKGISGAPREPRDPGGRAHAGGGEPPTLKELASDEMAEFRKRVVDEAIKPEALEHLLTDMEGLYETLDGGDAIVLDGGAAAHMGRNAATIRAALGHMIARRLEEVNPSARHLATMVDLNAEYGAKIKRVRKQEANASPTQGGSGPRRAVSQDDIEPLYTISQGLAAGLGRLAGPKARGR